jgi:hypothetical protein
VRSLNLNNANEWKNYCSSGDKPDDIPASPMGTYKDKGWKGMGDWLGTGTNASYWMEYRPFKEARNFVRKLNIQSRDEWMNVYCKSGKKPNDIPVYPHKTYKDSGWKGMSDWLGSKHRRGNWRSFEEARKFVHGLKLKSTTEYSNYCKSDKKPNDIPVSPRLVYKNKGWKNMGDWLGTGRIADQYKQYRSFKDAQKFAKNLNLNSSVEWFSYCKSGKRPDDIPVIPNNTYKNKGWISWPDFLGYEPERKKK